MVISADMVHTQRQHAHYPHRRGAYFGLPVGGNQPALFDQLDALAWAETPIGWMTYNRGHGRQEIRTIQVSPATKQINDVTLGEDRCRVRTGALPSILAVMRSHTIGALRLLGFTNIAEGTRWARDDFTRPLTVLGLT